jgi:hypothetical protein
VEVQADAAERRTGGSRHHHRRDFLSEPVIRFAAPVVGLAQRPEYLT